MPKDIESSTSLLVLSSRIIFTLCVIVLTLLVYLNSRPRLAFLESSKRVSSVSENIIKSLPVRINNIPAPNLTAQSVIVYDPESQIVIFSKNANTPVPMASTTKVMTALIALENFSLTDPITVTNANQSIGSKAEIQPGEVWTVESLLYALMLPSGNDAAVALAESYPSGYQGFVSAMNQKAKALHLNHTHFDNVSGIDQAGHFSTAADLAILTQFAMNHPTFATIVNTKQITIWTVDSRVNRTFVNLNELLGSVPGVRGVKTGKSEGAGECLITSINRENHPIIVVVLGSQARFAESKQLIEWVYQTYQWQTGVSLN